MSIPSGLQPVGGQVEPACARILAHVAGDIRQLHRHAEVTGARQRVGVTHLHQDAHHRPHGGGDARGIGPQIREAGIAPFHPVPGKPFQQRLGQVAGHVVGLDQIGHRAVGGRVPGPPGIGEVESVAQRQNGGGFVVAEIHLVIRNTAEGVKRQRRVAHAGGQKLGRGVEGIGALGNRRAAVVEVGRLIIPPRASLCIGEGRGASGTSLVSTSEDVTTEGIPAPGCVPAPTRYRFATSSETLCGRNHALWKMRGSRLKPAPWGLR
jgi:hypothetical protein